MISLEGVRRIIEDYKTLEHGCTKISTTCSECLPAQNGQPTYRYFRVPRVSKEASKRTGDKAEEYAILGGGQ